MGVRLYFYPADLQGQWPNGQILISKMPDPEYDTSGPFQNQRTLSQVKMPTSAERKRVSMNIDASNDMIIVEMLHHSGIQVTNLNKVRWSPRLRNICSDMTTST